MKTKLLTAFLFLIVTATPVLAERPSIGLLDQKLDALIKVLGVCPPGGPDRFVDNGDGTICDHQTGLMWEKKGGPDDGWADLNNPHDINNRYNWSNNSDGDETNPDGTLFTDFLARLNGVVAGSEPSEQLGGYSDWRLPTLAELQTILDCSFFPCLDAIFGPDADAWYWSSTSSAEEPNAAWSVDFEDGSVADGNWKQGWLRVRAVRGGR